MAIPRTFAAIDVGSNGIRLLIARLTSHKKRPWKQLAYERQSIRLGTDVFKRKRIPQAVMGQALDGFRQFQALFEKHKIKNNYRAVATSAMRDARNGDEFVELIRANTGIHLEIIDGEQEARLTTTAINHAFPRKNEPDFIFDLGGGSLQLIFKDRGVLPKPVSLPLGTVRMMEQFEIAGPISDPKRQALQHHILQALEKVLPSPPKLKKARVAASGGNAEDLAMLAPKGKKKEPQVLDVRSLEKLLPELLKLDELQRQIAYGIHLNRAEVIGIAGITIATLSRFLNFEELAVPGVGVREGLLWEYID